MIDHIHVSTGYGINGDTKAKGNGLKLSIPYRTL